MDWSDDVAYSVHDVEDAIASGWLDPRRAAPTGRRPRSCSRSRDAVYAPDLDRRRAAARPGPAAGLRRRARRPTTAPVAPSPRLKDMTSRLIGRFVARRRAATRERARPRPADAATTADLVVPRDARAECTVLKAVADHYVMYADERVRAARPTSASVVARARRGVLAARPAGARPRPSGPTATPPTDDAARAARRRRPGRLADRRSGRCPARHVEPPAGDRDRSTT